MKIAFGQTQQTKKESKKKPEIDEGKHKLLTHSRPKTFNMK